MIFCIPCEGISPIQSIANFYPEKPYFLKKFTEARKWEK